MNWSEEQKKVIDTRDANILVSAAAGSGKTAVLVERIIQRIIRDGIGLDELIVMTFTKAAAAEMRERIEKALRMHLMEHPEDTHAALQLAILPRARISTIDSVCQNIIRQYYQYIDLDPGFRVADEGELKILKSDIIDELLTDKFEEADPGFMRFADSFSQNGSDKRIAALINKLFDFSQSQTFPERYLQQQLTLCECEQQGDIEDTAWCKYALSDIRETLRDFIRILNTALTVCDEADGPFKYSKEIESCISLAQELASITTYAALYEAVDAVEFGKMPSILAKDGCDPSKKELVKSIRDDFKDYLNTSLRSKLLVLPPELLKETVSESAKINAELIKLTIAFSENFSERKRQADIVDFSDLEHFALKLLYEEVDGEMVPSQIADTFAAELKEIMIDEYQDSNAVQEALLQAMSAERFGRPDVFMVGDVKQSIYRFRQADPAIFIGKYDTFTAEGKDIKIELNSNFRSRREIIDSTNAVFDRIMRKNLGGIEYDADSRLKARADYKDNLIEDGSNRESACKTEILIADNKDPEAAGIEMDTEEIEYRMIAKRINEMIDQYDPRKNIRVQDKDTKEFRPAKYSDIVVLMRAAKGHAEKLVEILTENGIPTKYSNSSGYFSATEIECVLSLLNVIDNPHQDIPLVTVMRSPMFSFSDDELARIKALYMHREIEDTDETDDREIPEYESRKADFWDAVKYAALQNKKVQAFVEKLKSFRLMADVVPVHILLNEIYADTGYYHYVSAMPGGNIRRKNLDMLIEKAENYGSTVLHGLFNFTRYIEVLKKNEFDYGEADADSGNDNAVCIYTIHGSKGLEYPIVFLARTSASQKTVEDEEGVLIDGTLGVGSDYKDAEENVEYPGLKKAVIRMKNHKEDVGEHLRLLYVAMTRAKEKLIITGTKSSTQKKSAYEKTMDIIELGEALKGSLNVYEKMPVRSILGYSQYLDWILLAAGNQRDLFDLKFFNANDVLENEQKEKKNLLRAVSEYAGFLTGDAVLSGADENYADKLEKIFNAEYNHEAETMLKPKKSVSELKIQAMHHEEDKAFLYNAWEAVMNGEDPFHGGKDTEKNMGAARGTAFHRAMELMPYLDDAESNLAYLRTCGRMKQEDLEILDVQAVLAFLDSDLGKRMAKAYRGRRLKREQHFMSGIPARVLDPEQNSDELQILQGIIDAYIEEEDGTITLIDYKTDRVSTESELAERYRVQLELYAASLRQLTHKQVGSMIIYSTYFGKQILL